MNNPRRHHFVPRFYLAGFCPDSRDTLAVYDRARNAYRAQRPAELAHRRDFYAYEDEEGNRYFDIEAGLGEIEAATRAVIQRIDAEEPLEVDDRHTLATYAGFSRSCAVAIALHRLYGYRVELQHLSKANPSIVRMMAGDVLGHGALKKTRR